ncbi:MAG: preprotein translocase subunit SecG [Elusimicrobia bacterium RIFCSPLOWO2_01_FULL_60_11]|nr:MAG: preprotein translocase subunit SecG [Elusimicrobia bacterium RIFCSPLOWO2_01_FULL_60_11]
MYELILGLHVLICAVLMIVILIQTGKGAGLSGMFGGGSDALFSAPSGSAFLKKATVGLAVGFVVTTLFLTILHTRRSGRSVLERVPIQQQQ